MSSALVALLKLTFAVLALLAAIVAFYEGHLGHYPAAAYFMASACWMQLLADRKDPT